LDRNPATPANTIHVVVNDPPVANRLARITLNPDNPAAWHILAKIEYGSLETMAFSVPRM
jgi:hypothetical protein